ncbi:MAG: RNA polymerase sigma factor [Bacteroidota bacterium]
MPLSKNSVCNERVFERVFEEHGTTLRNYIYYKCGDTALAEDMVQEAFIKLWDHCAKVPIENAKAFVYKVAYNFFLKDVAKKKVRLVYKQGSIPKVSQETPEYLLQEKEFQIQLETAIANLSEKQREVFLLHKIEKKKYKEIAEMLGISVKAVEKRMHAGLVQLRKEINYFKRK